MRMRRVAASVEGAGDVPEGTPKAQGRPSGGATRDAALGSEAKPEGRRGGAPLL